MSGSTRFVLPYQTAIDATGLPYAGGQLFFYASGTTTPQPTYSDSGLTTPNSNPVIANSGGQFPNIFLSGSAYRVVLEDASGDQIWTADPVSVSASFNGNVTASGPGLVGFVADNTTSGARWEMVADANGNFDVVYLNSNLTAFYSDTSGNLGVSGNVTAEGSLNSGGAASIGATLTVAGTSSLRGNTSVTGTLSSTGNLSTGGTFNATGLMTAGGALGVGGQLTVAGAASVGNTLSVSSTLTVVGDAGLQGNLTVGDNLYVPGGVVSISGSCTAQVFNTTSDERTKTNIATITSAQAWAWINDAAPVTFTDQGGRQNVAGFIAQTDAANVRSSAVSLIPDATMQQTGSSPAGERYVRDYTQDIAYLTAALQDLQARFTALHG